MAGLTIKISADTQGAITQFNELGDSQNRFVKSLEDADKALGKSNLDAFTDRQALARAAITATRGETEALSSSVKAYQNKIESLIKQGISPENEEVKKLATEMESMKSRRDAIITATEDQARKEAELAQKFEEAAKAAEREAAVVVKSLDAKSDLEKQNIRLADEQDRLRESIKSLVSSGMSPENEEIKKLEAEYKKLSAEIDTNNRVLELQENAAKGAAVALAAIAAATVAVIAGSVKAAAKVEDMRAAYTTLLGSQEKAAELVTRINKEAATTPFEIESISASMNKLLPLFKGNSDAAVKAFRMIGDTAGGNAEKLATLTDAYTKVQMKGKASMTELNRISNAGVPIFDALSTKFGITAAELFEMSKNGDITAEHLTDAFKSMTSEGGTFFNGMENSSDTFNMRLLGLKENVGLVAAQIGEKFLPGLKDVLGAAGDAVAKFSEWIGEGENLDYLLATLGYTLAGVTAGLAAFLVVAKGHAAVTEMKKAFNGLREAISGNWLGALAVVVTSLAVPAFIALAKHIDNSQHKVRELNKEFEKGKGIYSEAVTALDGLGKGKTLDAETTEKLIKLYPELTGKIEAYKTATENALGMVNELNTQNRINYINELSKAYTDETNAITAQIKKIDAAQKSLDGTRKESDLYNVRQGNLAALEKDLEKMKRHAEETSLSISKAYEGFEAMGSGHIPKISGAGTAGGNAGNEAGDSFVTSYVKTLAEKLKDVKLTPEQDLAQDMAEFEAYLNRMADMENLSGEARVAAIESQEQRIRKDAKLTADEQIALTNAVTAATDAAREAQTKKEADDAVAAAAERKRLQEEEKAAFALKLENMGQTEAQYQQEAVGQFSKYLEDRTNAQFAADELDLEQQILQAEAKKEFLAQQIAEIKEINTLSDEEELIAERALAEQIKKIDQSVADSKKKLGAEQLDAMKTLYSGMRDLLLAGLGETRAAAIAERAIATAEGVVHTASAAIKALDSGPPPWNIAAAAGVVAAGVAQQIKIHSTPIPSAETGGRFIMPQTATGVDGGLLRMNQGEVADITPRGGVAEGGGARIIINLDGRPIVDLMNVNLRSGDIYETSPAWPGIA